MSSETKAYRASLFHFPEKQENNFTPFYEYIEDGLLFVKNGLVSESGSFNDLKSKISPDIPVTDYRKRIIMPGFIDCHVHYAQIGMIASYGKQLLDWLKYYTFPEELKFSDKSVCRKTACFFLDQLLHNGTTTALVLPTTHSQSVHVLFEEAEKRNMRIVSGKIMMDVNAPEGLLETTEKNYVESESIIKKWHGKGRSTCAVIPRFALTSSEKQLETASTLLKGTPDVLFHTHLAENIEEVHSVAKMFPWSKSYLDVYDRFNLVGKNSSFAHSIHLDENDLNLLKEKNASIVHCPDSNLFLGSGVFDMKRIIKHNIRTCSGTDVGAGTSLSMFKTMAEAYKLSQLSRSEVHPSHFFYMATTGGASTLNLSDKIGNFTKGNEADFIVINTDLIPILRRRIDQADNFDEILFAIMMLGDDRIIENVYISGNPVHQSEQGQ